MLALLLTLLPTLLPTQWQPRGDEGDITIETRTMPGSGYEAVRVRRTVKVPPAIQAEAIWGPAGIDGVANKKAVKTHEVIVDKPNEREFYQMVSAPLISDRDYIVHCERRADGVVHEIKWWTIEHPKFPPVKGKVRAPNVSGQCVIEPSEDGGSVITYEIFTDLGGALPAWIAKSAIRDSAVEWIKVMSERGMKRWQASK